MMDVLLSDRKLTSPVSQGFMHCSWLWVQLVQHCGTHCVFCPLSPMFCILILICIGLFAEQHMFEICVCCHSVCTSSQD